MIGSYGCGGCHIPVNFDVNDAGDINDIPVEVDTSVVSDAEVPDAGNDGGELDAGTLDVSDSGVNLPDASVGLADGGDSDGGTTELPDASVEQADSGTDTGTPDGSVTASDGGSCISDLDCPAGEACLNGDGCTVFVGCEQGNEAICHFPQGTSDWNFHTICVGSPSWPAHQTHSDYLGICLR